MPRWGRPPGARLGRRRDGVSGEHQSWKDDERFEEIDTADEARLLRPSESLHGYGYGYDEYGRFQSDELMFDGLETNAKQKGSRRSIGQHGDDPELSDEDAYFNDYRTYSLSRENSRQSVLVDREEELVAGALERIARARAQGKSNVKLSQAEIDALDRAEMSTVQQQPRISAAPKALPASKKTAKSSEAGKKQRSDSPKTKPGQGRARNRSNASTRSTRQEDDLVAYPVPPQPDYGYPGHPAYPAYPAYPPVYPMYPPDPRFAYQGSPLRPGASRANSYQNMRQMAAPMYPPAPPAYYPQSQRYVSMPEAPYYGYPDPNMNRMRADSTHSSRSNSSVNVPMANYPVSQFPNPTPKSRARRSDPPDPRSGGSPARRPVSGNKGNPTPQRSRRPSDELFIPDPDDRDTSGSSRGRSDSDGSYHDQEVDVEVLEKSSAKGGYTVKTRSATKAGPTKSTGSAKTKTGAAKAVRRR